MNFMAAYGLANIDRPGFWSLVVDHLDLQYDYSEYAGDPSVTGTNLQSLSLVIR